jgi:bifunctional DNA-binding transcriptional regulator/antitoxin component of YhaV-PrlF toxin-antitoxin module
MRQKRTKRPKRSGFSEDAVPFQSGSEPAEPTHATVELAAGGRLVIPATMRTRLGMKVGDRLTVRIEGNELRIHTYEEGLRQANELVEKYLPGVGVEEFLRWKREEGTREVKKLERRSRDE